jgi:hypothetical protein
MTQILPEFFSFVCEFFAVGIVVFLEQIVNGNIFLQQFVVQGGGVVVLEYDIC